MISIYKQNDKVSAYVTEFICDTVADIANLPTEKNKVYPGSAALVASTGDIYILNANRKWVLFGAGNSGSGSESGDIEGIDLAEKEDIEQMFEENRE